MESNIKDDLIYNHGFGNNFETEAVKGALPIGRSNPQKCNFGLYAEQLSGTSFTSPRHKNLKSWLYRILPTVGHTKNEPIDKEYPNFISDFNGENMTTTPDQLRWKPFPFPKDDEKVDFVKGISTYCGVGSPAMKVF